ncbi:MAG: insulinase family protein [Verrucomicrobiota bacterium]
MDLRLHAGFFRLRAVLFCLAVGALGACTRILPPTAAPLRIPPPPIHELRLENGLRIFVVPRHTSPTFAAVYGFDVGAADDPRGKSGIAHLLEHMMFTGTRDLGALDPQREAVLAARLDDLWRVLDNERNAQRLRPSADDAGRQQQQARIAQQTAEIHAVTSEYRGLVARDEFDLLLDRSGSRSKNAFTGKDYTSYVVQLPASRLELWFRLESDRLLHPVFRDFYTERDVVREERRRGADTQPGAMLYEALNAMLFSAHPYGTPIVGWPGDLEQLHRDDARAYFRTHYAPAHCALVLVGDVQPAEVERLAKKYLGPWQNGPAIPRHLTPEPEQHGERRRVIEVDATPRLYIGWPTVPKGHPDQYALDIVAQVLSVMNRSRFSRDGLSAYAQHTVLASAGYFMVGVYPDPGRWVASQKESAVARTIRRLQERGVAPWELARAKLDLQNSFLPGLDDDLQLAHRVTEEVMTTGDTSALHDYPRRIASVTAVEVQEVARRYLRADHKNVAELRRPAKNAPSVVAAAGPVAATKSAVKAAAEKPQSAAFTAALAELQAAPVPAGRSPTVGKEIERIVLPSGITLFLQEDHSKPAVSLHFAWRGGVNSAPLKDLAAYQVASSLLSHGGTTRLSAAALQERERELGMRFDISLGETLSEAKFFAPAQSFAAAYDVALDVLKSPRIGEFSTWGAKFGYLSTMRMRGENLESGANQVASHVLAGDDPRLGYVPGKWQLLLTTWPYQVRRLWRRYLGRDNLYIAAVGDFDKRALAARIESTLGAWRRAEDSRRVDLVRPVRTFPGAFLVRRAVPGVAVTLVQQLAVDRTAPEADHAALAVLKNLLDSGDLQSRLMARLRQEEGLTYSIGAALAHEGRPGVPGQLRIEYQTRSARVLRSIDCVLQELERLRTVAVSQAEIDAQLQRRNSYLPFHYASPAANVSRIMLYELEDRPWDYDRQKLAAMAQVTPAEVLRVAQKYLHPAALTIALFGTLTPEEEAQLKSRFALRVLDRKQVFKGGYE